MTAARDPFPKASRIPAVDLIPEARRADSQIPHSSARPPPRAVPAAWCLQAQAGTGKGPSIAPSAVHFAASPWHWPADASAGDKPSLLSLWHARTMNPRLAGRLLYIADLIGHQTAMECGDEPMNPIGYRVLAKRLCSALAGRAPCRLRHELLELPLPLFMNLVEALETRRFNEYGELNGAAARAVKSETQKLLSRLQLPDAPSA